MRTSPLLTALAAAALIVATAFAADGPTTKPATTKPASSQPAATVPDKWKLVWSDEFDYTGAPDPRKWSTEEGSIRNAEEQYYMRDRRENARVEDGCLIVEARKERIKNPKFDPKHDPADEEAYKYVEFFEYTSASLSTQGKAEFTFGRFEMRAKLPIAPGSWPAFWVMGASFPKVTWPFCGEMDILECYGQRPNRVDGVVHGAKDGKHRSAAFLAKSKTPLDEWHTYVMEWYPDYVKFYFDGQMYNHQEFWRYDDNGEAFRKPFYMMISLALGSQGGKIDDEKLPQKWIIDYVRVYQLKDPPKMPATAPATSPTAKP